MAYAAEHAEIALLSLLDTQTGAQMAGYVRELLRTRQLHSDISGSAEPIANARLMTSLLLRHKKFPQLNEPSEVDLQQAVQAYLDAPAPTDAELEERYQRLMARAKYPNRLHDLHYHGPSDAEGYRRLASGLTREMKNPDDTPYTADELQAIALVCEHYTNLRQHGNPWLPVTVARTEHIPSLVHRMKDESDISYAERSYYEAVNRASRIYTGSILRDPVTSERKARVKDIYHPEYSMFMLAPSLPLGTDYEQFAKSLFAEHKMHIRDASTRVGKLAEALKAYQEAFDNLLSLQQSTLATAPDSQAHASFVATASLRRELVSMRAMLMRAGFSHEATSTALFRFTARLGLSNDIASELDESLAKAAEVHNEPLPVLDTTARREWLNDVHELQPYVSTRALFHPAQGVEPLRQAPAGSISAATIAHLATIGLATPRLGPHMD